MQHLSTFLDVVHRSGLVAPDVLNLAFEECKKESPDLDATKFSEQLIKRKILTKWQVGHLMRGKYKGFIVGQHKVLGVLGKGGHATVYLAEHLTLRQSRVIKVLSQSRVQGNSSLLERFVREAQATSQFNHPHVIRCFDVVVEPKMAYIVMEYCKGRDLEKVVKEDGPLSFGKCVNFAIQVIDGLNYIKNSGMIHRDIKPSNLFLLSDHNHVKILDLGLALILNEEDGSLTQTYEDNLGTADYIAPEQAVNSHTVDFRADIYSLGCTLYHWLTGRAPFNKGTIVQRLAQHQSVMPATISSQRPDTPKILEKICWKMIQKSPDDRFQSYEELSNVLKSLLPKRKRVAAGSGGHGSSFRPIPSGSNQSHPQPQPISDINAIDTDPISSAEVPTIIGEEVADDPFAMVSATAVPAAQPLRPRTKVKRTVDEEQAYARFLRRERLKTLWVVVGLLVGIGISVGIIVANNAIQKANDEEKPPPTAVFEQD